MRERLIELLKMVEYQYTEIHSIMTQNVADFLLQKGVIVPPCKVGQTVYKVVNDKRVKKPYKCKVIGFWYSEDEHCNNVHLVRYINGVFDCSFSVPFTDFGKTVFLTKEEAEQALKGGEE